MKLTTTAALTGMTALILAGTGVGVAVAIDQPAAQPTHQPTTAVSTVPLTGQNGHDAEHHHTTAKATVHGLPAHHPTVQARTAQHTTTRTRTAAYSAECPSGNADHHADAPTQTRPTTRSQPGAPVHHPEDADDDGDAHGYGTDH